MTMAGNFLLSARMFPHGSMSAFNPNDKTNLAPYRFLHFVVIVILVIRFVPKDWPGLHWKVFDPLIVCGQQSLAVFCVGVFLSFVGHFELSMSSGSLFAQIFVSITGIAIMTAVAYYISWSKGRTSRRSLHRQNPLPPRSLDRNRGGYQPSESGVGSLRALLTTSLPRDETPPHSVDQPTSEAGARPTVLAPFSLQRERPHLADPATAIQTAARNSSGASKMRPPAASTRSHGGIDITDIEVEKPERNRVDLLLC